MQKIRLLGFGVTGLVAGALVACSSDTPGSSSSSGGSSSSSGSTASDASADSAMSGSSTSSSGAVVDASPDAITDAASPDSALPVPVLMDGTCQITVDGASYMGNMFTSVATGEPANWSLQCQSGDGVSLVRTVNVAARKMASPGTYVAGVAPNPDGIAAYSEQKSDGSGRVNYSVFTGWTVTLTAIDSKIAGAASVEGVLAGKPSKVSVAFNLALKPKP
jgi:hypothetical protein